MGIILDSSILVTAERKGNNARQTLVALATHLGNTEIAVSVITLLELAHGVARADTLERKAKRQQFIEEIADSPSCSSCLGGDCFTCRADRWTESGTRCPAAAFRSVDRGNCA